MNGKEIYDKIKNINYDLDLIDFVVYHNNCQDGFGSAWIVWRHLKGDATYLGVVPDKLPNVNIFRKKYVLFVDVSLSGKYLDEVKAVANNVLVIDHHQTYSEELEEHPNTIFDKEHSAIYITWRVFNPDQKIPQFIRYIEDNDLTKNEFNKTEAFVSAIGTKIPFHHIDYFKMWDKMLNPAFVESLINDGNKYQEYKNYLLKRNMHPSKPQKIGGYNVLIINFGAVGIASDLGNKISEYNPKSDFVILWSYHYNSNEFSIMLRTRRPNIDLSQIAKIYGGGGHPGAARFAWKGHIEDLWDDMNQKIKKSAVRSSHTKSQLKIKSKSKSKSKSKPISQKKSLSNSNSNSNSGNEIEAH
jgi:oligoribonuclease NrnB/cAMP/cGMP phosphodiesterase (DHH superfamily)